MPFYSKPLVKGSAEYLAGIAESEKARENGSLEILELEYEIRFKKSSDIGNYLEGFQYLDVANEHGGVFAVLQEAMKRNLQWPILLGFDLLKSSRDISKKEIERSQRLLLKLKSEKNPNPQAVPNKINTPPV